MREPMSDLISRQAAVSIPILPKEHRKAFKSLDDAFETGWNEALSCVNMLPSAEPEPSELARDIATIIANEMDMRVILKNADAEPCDFCIYNKDCEEMRMYCPARGRKTNGEV